MAQKVEDLTDNMLLAQCRGNSQSAFNTLFRRYFDDLLQYAIRQLNEKELAEEMVMDLMMKLWQRTDASDIQHLDQYLYRSLKNAIISHWRKKALSFISLEAMHESNEPMTHSADYRITDLEVQAIYRNKLAALSSQRRMIYQMSREQEMTNAEIAQQTSLSINTVKNHLKASLNYFRENLKTYTEATLILLLLLLF